DEERYSRQMYALGARAHGLVRSTTAILDVPSGLLYEIAKNLALSGVGRIILVRDDNNTDDGYFDGDLDDLGGAYRRAALAEIIPGSSNQHDKSNNNDVSEDHVALGSNPVVVCVDRSISAQLEMNDACRNSTSSVPFVSVETAGVYSRIFCDFGPSFVVVDEDGETPRSTLMEKVEILAGDDGTEQHFTVHCLEGERHDVSRGNVIEFQGDYSQDGVRTATFPQCEVSPSSKATLDSLLEGEARSFSRIKLPRTIAFTSLRDILHPPFDPSRRKAVMSSMAALDLFVKKYGRLPLQSNASNGSGSKSKRTDVERFQSLVRKTTKVEISETWDTMISQFARTCRAKFTPVQAFSGALGAQEVLKGATKLYNPVHQFLLYDCDEVLQNNDGNARFEDDAFEPIARGQSYILGNELSRKLALSRIFLVGAGAIGCELLKNLAAMGAGTGSSNTNQGCLIITDMDTIERSNLSRQLLFRDHDVGEFKSAAARTAVLRFLPDCRIEAHTSRVGEEEDGPFDDDFWSSGCSVVLNALDNVEARLFVDSQCVAHGLGLIDAGTLGPKGNVQVVIPHQSESYGSSADPPEPDIPVCTLKNFPYEISHTIQWARDLFDGYFHRRPRQANDHLGEDAALDMAEELGEDLGVFPFVVGELDSNDPEYKVCLAWAIKQAHRLFFVAMDELVQKHPIDSVDDDGALFWSGTRRAPKPFRFVSLNSDADEFVKAAARLRMESFLPVDSAEGTSALVSLEDALTSLEGHYTRLQSKDNHILRNLSGGDGSSTLDMVLEKLNGAKTGASFMPSLNLADFEKDDDNNGHVAFVTAASNLRALSYGIKPADTMETRRVAGRIVPAMITTTGLVSALSCLEFVKMLKGLPLNMHRNAFVNMALPFFAFTAPLPAEEVAGVNRSSHTIWDRVIVKGSSKSPVGAMTLRTFLDKVKRSSGFGDDFEVANLSYGPFMIYANFLHSEDDELLDAPLLDTV
ncbi:ubiquitin activating enzyme, partial [Thalassiosira pseudonana CCMP1335]